MTDSQGLALRTRRGGHRLPIVFGGAGHGLTGMQPSIVASQEETRPTRVLVADPVPGKAAGIVSQLRETGIAARAAEEPVQRVVERITAHAIVLQIDDAGAVAACLRASEDEPVPVHVYNVLRTSDEEVYAMRFVLQTTEEKRTAAGFFECLSRVLMRGGRDEVFGPERPAGHVLHEPVYRDWFGAHFRSVMARSAAGLPPEAHAAEATPDGRQTLPVFLVEAGDKWRDPLDLARGVVNDALVPVAAPGRDFLIAEFGAPGIRFHAARVRKTDRVLRVRKLGNAVEEAPALEYAPDSSEETVPVVVASERREVTRTRPAWFTD